MTKTYKFEKLHEKLFSILKEEKWEVNERFLSEAQICQKFHCSRQTVRKALARLIEEGYIYSQQGSGTFVSKKVLAMKRRKSNSIGILVTYLSDYIFPMIIRELEEEFTKEGFTVQLASSANSSKQEAELLQKMLENKVDGIILEPSRSAFPSPNVQMYQDLLKENFPLVSIHSKYDGLEIPTVAFNDKGAGYLAAEYLFELGHEKIGAILKADDKQGHKRYQGILQAHQEAGRTFDDKNVYWYTTEDIKNFAEAKEVILKRLETSSAVICYNDHIGIQYEKMLLEEGLHIPDTQSILSIDNSKYAELAPVAMTAVSSPIKEIGKFAAKSLIQQIRGEDFTKEKMFEPVLVKRGSTSFYRKGK